MREEIKANSTAEPTSKSEKVRKGEIIGLTGLAGHGQTRMLLQIYSRHQAEVMGAQAFIAGDRQSEGVFNLWSIGRNITTRSLTALRKAGFIDLAAEATLAETVMRQDLYTLRLKRLPTGSST